MKEKEPDNEQYPEYCPHFDRDVPCSQCIENVNNSMNTKEQWEENLLLILAVRNEQVYKDVWSFIKEIKEQAKKEERERIKDKIGNIFNCLSDIDEYTDKMAIERMFKIWESL